jgi:DNA-directed RNA polymerase specialized sigma24 family protein
MRSSRARAAATVAALLALVGLVGSAVFLAAREDSPPPPTTTTTSSTTTTTITDDEVAEAIADALQEGLPVALSDLEAGCIAGSLLDVVDVEQLERLVGHADPLTSLPEPERALLVRVVVECVPPAKAAALLGSPTTTSPPAELPDEDL